MPKEIDFAALPNGESGTIKIEEISAEEARNRRPAGSAYGIDLNHCIYLGLKHGDRFAERVRSYRIIEDGKQLEKMRRFQPQTICVQFYE